MTADTRLLGYDVAVIYPLDWKECQIAESLRRSGLKDYSGPF